MLHTFDRRSASGKQMAAGTTIRCTTCHRNIPKEEVMRQQEAEEKGTQYEGTCHG